MNEPSMHARIEPVRDRFVAVRPATVTLPAPPRRTPEASLRFPSAVESAAVPAVPDARRLPAGDRAALLVGTAVHDHAGYPLLPVAAAGLRQLRQVLERADVGMVDTCQVVADGSRGEIMRAVETFLDERALADTVLVYLTGYAQVSGADGRLYLAAADTDPADLERTAVPADFLRDQLQECRAASKVVLLDACLPGAETDRFAVQRSQVMLEPAGVYVISASPAPQPASVMAEPVPQLGTSRFTGEIVEGLRTGRVKDGLGPWVTAEDLARYLTTKLVAQGVPAEQLPATSTLAVTGNHVIARSAVRALSLLDGNGGRDVRGTSAGAGGAVAVPADGTAGASGGAGAAGGDHGDQVADPGWREVIAYYRSCLAEAPSPEALPVRGAESADWFPMADGAEALLSGAEPTTLAPAGVDTFDWKERDVWYGYPLVTLAGAGRRHSGDPLAPSTVAPLLVRRAEVTVDARGAAALRPVGPVLPHAGILQACLDDQEAASVLAAWRQSWKPGDRDQLLVAIRQLLKRLGLDELSRLDPAALGAVDQKTANRTGVHNTAGVLYVESERAAQQAVAAELAELGERLADVPGTALEFLGKPVGLRTTTRAAVAPVLPAELNESQQTVLTAAMSRPLTVVTAPPGTGKDELLVDVVATAVAAGQKVLVASADDAALQRLADRCGSLVTGLLIKTGDAQARAEEKQVVRELLRSTKDASGGRSRGSVAAELAAAQLQVKAWRNRLAERNDLETLLRKTTAARSAAAERLGVPPELLAAAWRGDDAGLSDWVDRARTLTETHLMGGLRRRNLVLAFVRAMADAGADSGAARELLLDPAAFDSLMLFARAEDRLREDRREALAVSDDALDLEGRELSARVAELSAELLAVVVAEQAGTARERLEARRIALEPGGRNRQSSHRELLSHLGGWAVTPRDAGQLALEPGMFDLVVIDDAHHCPVSAALPLLFRARRALVVGDPRQRLRTPGLSDHRLRRARRAAGLSAGFLSERRLSFRGDSVFDAALPNVEESLLLDEHDGAHPGIARIVDEHFYGGRLTVVTDVGALPRAHDAETGDATLLLWEDVTGTPERGANGGSWRNQAEIDRVVWAVKELREQLPADATVAVATPFRAQAEELRSLFRFEPVPVACVADGDAVDCDAVVLSLVAGDGMPEQTLRWAQGQTALWSGALARARAHVVTVGQHGFWSRQAGLPALLARMSSVRSFHVRPNPPAPMESAVFTDPLVEALCTRLEAAGAGDVEPNAVVDGYRVDVLVRTPSGSTAVLLDRGWPGEDAARHLRLLLRRRRLLTGLVPESGLPPVTRVLRVPTWQVRSGEPIDGLLD
ncbi:AAA domain-containing protein [Jiangella alba]|uniref:Part of AAA domain-containing protein n=1 Tax=Jiangella alba TaxID=561176 RepID=A0A1H5PSR4_9ACTN|nr:AAA domain-containing protein [Jiangella alba]SEF16684.1 Part of AAA domain-containing protein [Jiangella alba]